MWSKYISLPKIADFLAMTNESEEKETKWLELTQGSREKPKELP